MIKARNQRVEMLLAEQYMSGNIVDVNNNEIFVKISGPLKKYDENTNVTVKICDGVLYEFYTTIKKIREDLLAITIPPDYTETQRRTFVRLPISLEVDIVVISQSNTVQKGEMVNLSGSGMLLKTEDPLEADQLLQLSFLLNDIKMVLTGQVVWIKPTVEGYKLGVHFTNLSEQTINQIAKFVFQEQLKTVKTFSRLKR